MAEDLEDYDLNPDRPGPTVSEGFQDKSGVYPQVQYHRESGINVAAREATSNHRKLTGRRGPRVSSRVPQTAARVLSEPPQDSQSQYPYNNAIFTASGHKIEYDDTPGYERINIEHRTGSKIEMFQDGSVVARTNGSSYEMILGDKEVVVRGHVTIVAESNVDLRVQGDMNMEVDGDLNQLVHGNHNVEVLGNENTRVHGNVNSRITGGQLDETRGNVVRRTFGNLRERVLGDADYEMGASWTTTAEGAVHWRSYGEFQGSFYGGYLTLNGEDRNGNPGAGAVTTATIHNTETFNGVVGNVSSSFDVSGPVTALAVQAVTATIPMTRGNLIGAASYSASLANVLSSVTALSNLSLPNLSGLGSLGTNILNNIGTGLMSDLTGQLSALAGTSLSSITGSISGAYASIGGLYDELDGFTNLTDLAGSIQGFNFDYDLNLQGVDLSTFNSLKSTVEGITDLDSTAWHVATANLHEFAAGVTQSVASQQAVQVTRSALEKISELGIDVASVIASAAFTNYSSLADIEADIDGFISDLGSIDSSVSDVAAAAKTLVTERSNIALSAIDINNPGSVPMPTAPVGPAATPSSTETVVDVTGTSDAFILDLDRQPVTGLNKRLLDTGEVVARARNKSLRTNSNWLQDQLNSGAITSSIASTTPPRTKRTGSKSVAARGKSIRDKRPYALSDSGLLRVQTIPARMLIAGSISKATRLSPNFKVSSMTGADNLVGQLKAQRGLTATQIANNMQLVSYNVLELLRNKYNDTWTISEGLYNLLENEKIDSNSITNEMSQGLGVGIQFVTQPNEFYFDAAQWIRNNLVYDKLILSYIDYDPSGVNEPTIIVTVKPGDNARSVSTEFNHVKVADNILDLA